VRRAEHHALHGPTHDPRAAQLLQGPISSTYEAVRNDSVRTICKPDLRADHDARHRSPADPKEDPAGAAPSAKSSATLRWVGRGRLRLRSPTSAATIDPRAEPRRATCARAPGAEPSRAMSVRYARAPPGQPRSPRPSANSRSGQSTWIDQRVRARGLKSLVSPRSRVLEPHRLFSLMINSSRQAEGWTYRPARGQMHHHRMNPASPRVSAGRLRCGVLSTHPAAAEKPA
jgi:hypothetical protein